MNPSSQASTSVRVSCALAGTSSVAVAVVVCGVSGAEGAEGACSEVSAVAAKASDADRNVAIREMARMRKSRVIILIRI